MMLLPDWPTICKHAWSFRWSIAASVLSGLEVALPLTSLSEGIPRGTFAALSGICAAAASFSRLLAQKTMPRSTHGDQ